MHRSRAKHAYKAATMYCNLVSGNNHHPRYRIFIILLDTHGDIIYYCRCSGRVIRQGRTLVCSRERDQNG